MRVCVYANNIGVKVIERCVAGYRGEKAKKGKERAKSSGEIGLSLVI
jgi:hypothetical protein